MAEFGLAVAGLAVAIPTIIEPTLRTVQFIRETLENYKKSDVIHARLILRLDLHLVQIANLAIFIYGPAEEGQITTTTTTTSHGHRTAQEATGRRSNGSLAASLDPTSHAVLVRVLTTLDCILEDFIQKLGPPLDLRSHKLSNRMRRFVTAMQGRSSHLYHLLHELESWERYFSNVIFSACLASGRQLPLGLGVPPEIGPNGTREVVMADAHDAHDAHPPAPEPTSADTRSLAVDLATLIQHCCVAVQPLQNAPRLRLTALPRSDCVRVAYTALLQYRTPSSAAPSPSPSSPGASYFLEIHRPNKVHLTDTRTRDIAAFLHWANPRLVALLPCRGFSIEKSEPGSDLPDEHTLVFDMPPGLSRPRSLREALLDARNTVKHALDERLGLMKRLASALLFIHTANHLHKSIRADNVVLLQPETEQQEQREVYMRLSQLEESGRSDNNGNNGNDSREGSVLLHSQHPRILGEPFLVGFDISRPTGMNSMMLVTNALHQKYYLPVDRQDRPSRPHSMLDDVYSLGVLFLEIALWQSFVRFEPDSQRDSSRPAIPRTAAPESGGSWVASILMLDEDDTLVSAQEVHRRLISLAQKDVARSMGSIVSGIIVACLTCLNTLEDDHGSSWTSFGKWDDLADKDGIVVGQAYIRKVIMMLETVSL